MRVGFAVVQDGVGEVAHCLSSLFLLSPRQRWLMNDWEYLINAYVGSDRDDALVYGYIESALKGDMNATQHHQTLMKGLARRRASWNLAGRCYPMSQPVVHRASSALLTAAVIIDDTAKGKGRRTTQDSNTATWTLMQRLNPMLAFIADT